MAEAPRLGFIGLGLMGQGFTKRLTSRGFAVTAYDLDAAKVETATAHGVIAAGSPAEVAAASDIVMTCVTTTDAVHAVVFGENGIATVGPAASKVLVDFSTTLVETTKAMATRLRDETGMGWVDAPVSGGPTAAEGGSLAIMAGGSDADFAAVSPVLGTLAGVLTHMGPVGAGQITKMINQVLVLNNYVILAEALALAEAGGIDASKVPAALASGHAGSNLLNAQFPRMIARDYAPLGYMRQVLKDLDMVHDMAKGLKVPTPMSATSAEMFRTLVNKGFGEIDGIAVLKLYDPKD